MVTPAYGIATWTGKGKLPRDGPRYRNQLFIGPGTRSFMTEGAVG